MDIEKMIKNMINNTEQLKYKKLLFSKIRILLALMLTISIIMLVSACDDTGNNNSSAYDNNYVIHDENILNDNVKKLITDYNNQVVGYNKNISSYSDYMKYPTISLVLVEYDNQNSSTDSNDNENQSNNNENPNSETTYSSNNADNIDDNKVNDSDDSKTNTSNPADDNYDFQNASADSPVIAAYNKYADKLNNDIMFIVDSSTVHRRATNVNNDVINSINNDTTITDNANKLKEAIVNYNKDKSSDNLNALNEKLSVFISANISNIQNYIKGNNESVRIKHDEDEREERERQSNHINPYCSMLDSSKMAQCYALSNMNNGNYSNQTLNDYYVYQSLK